jgi:hypothetical protein
MVERLRRHPLQADKLTLAALAGKLGLYLEPERVFEDDKTGPFRIAAFNMGILWATEGEQYSGRELSTMLAEAGFQDIQVIPTPGFYSIVTGRTP